jgi:hypothetical protein
MLPLDAAPRLIRFADQSPATPATILDGPADGAALKGDEGIGEIGG